MAEKSPPKKRKEYSPFGIERELIDADIVRFTLREGTSIMGKISGVDHYHFKVGNIIIFKHAIEFAEIDPSDDEDE